MEEHWWRPHDRNCCARQRQSVPRTIARHSSFQVSPALCLRRLQMPSVGPRVSYRGLAPRETLTHDPILVRPRVVDCGLGNTRPLRAAATGARGHHCPNDSNRAERFSWAHVPATGSARRGTSPRRSLLAKLLNALATRTCRLGCRRALPDGVGRPTRRVRVKVLRWPRVQPGRARLRTSNVATCDGAGLASW
jgi:hypothetical protein